MSRTQGDATVTFDDLPDEITALITEKLGDDVPSLSNLAQTSRRGRNQTRAALVEAPKDLPLTFGVAILEHNPDTVKLILGGPENWSTTDEAQIAVARTFSGFRIRGMAVKSEEQRVTEPEYIKTFLRAYPSDWESIEVFKMVGDWWHWACHTNIRLALRVDLLSMVLTAAEAFVENSYINCDYSMSWKDETLQFRSEMGTNPRKSIGFYISNKINARRNRSFVYAFPTKSNNGNIFLCGQRVTSIPSIPTRDTVNQWAMDVMSRIETKLGEEKLYDNLMVRMFPTRDVVANDVESLHVGHKTVVKRNHFSVRDKNIIV